MGEKTESDPKQAPKLEVQSAQHPQLSTGAEGRAQRLVQSPEEDPYDEREDAGDTKDKDSDKEEDRKHGDQTRDESGEKKKQSRPTYLGAAMPEDAAEVERREAINTTQEEASSVADHMRALSPLPFQIMNK